MRQYILKRVLLAIPVLFGVSIFVFGLVRFVPGDAAMMVLGDAAKTPEQVQRVRHELGLDRPVYEQYVTWLGKAAQGDMGKSFHSGKPVLGEIINRVPVTLELAGLAMIFALIIAVPVGVISASRQDTGMDYASRLISILGLAVPSFWLGTLIITLSAVWFQWIPPLGYVSPVEDLGRNLQQFILPALAMGAAISASLMRMTRSALLEVLRQDYVRTAWSKGLRERAVVFRHALKNAMIPVITIMGLQFGALLGGAVIMEQIFSLPGLGRLTLDSIQQRDYPQLQGVVLFISTIFVFLNLAVDVVYSWLDPRIHYQ